MREMIFAHRSRRELGDGTESQIRETEGGDVIIVGRNTFKEIVRGVHEGYLLPLQYVPPPAEPKKDEESVQKTPIPVHPPIPTSEYPQLPDPSPSPTYTFTYIPSLHILGIRHTPKRIYRFLTRRFLADDICKQVVACILEQSQREWTDEDSQHGSNEEKYWPKTVAADAEWRELMVIDTRIRPKLLWRQPEEAHEVYDDRESLTPEFPVNAEELIPTEEELTQLQAEKERPSASIFPPTSFPRQ